MAIQSGTASARQKRVKPKTSDGLELDRIDNDGWYCPDNCRWTDKLTNANNRRGNLNLEYRDDTMPRREKWVSKVDRGYKIVQVKVTKCLSQRKAK